MSPLFCPGFQILECVACWIFLFPHFVVAPAAKGRVGPLGDPPAAPGCLAAATWVSGFFLHSFSRMHWSMRSRSPAL
jgi:hypothetical protein